MTFGVKVSVNPEFASPARFASSGRCCAARIGSPVPDGRLPLSYALTGLS